MHAKIALQIALLVASGLADARSTNSLKARITGSGQRFVEYNPLVRPFAGSKAVYLAIPAGDIAVYSALRWGLHRPRAAAWFARVETGENLFCAWNNNRQKFTAPMVKVTPSFTETFNAPKP